MHVQATRDGRLDGAAAAEQLAHLASCPLCQAEQLADREIRARVESVVHDTNDVALRRLRQRVLAESDRVLSAREARTSRWRRPVAALGLAASVAAAALWMASAPSEQRNQPVVVTAERDAHWSRSVTRDVEHVDLSSGTLQFRVARQASDPRLVVRVPDGEIEDLGTTFSVTVSSGRTQEIAVQEGRVMFRRRGNDDLQLFAGSTWHASDEATRAPAAHDDVPAEPAPAPVSEPGDEAAMVKGKSPSHRAHLRVVREPASDAQPAPAASSAQEDAAYLHILALLHEQRGEEARLAAFAYLRSFPNGLKAREVRDVAEQYGKDRESPND